ncbi:MAG: DUF1549 domain-containing protein [Planctomycetes bacterium]|nr:DUF1549 domain-containing protein [Planctomycetota bacterium]
MKADETIIAEMTPLLEALCEDRLAPEQAVTLEQLALSSAEARWYYVTYVDLHGSLYWNAAGVGSAEALSSEEIPVYTGVESTVPVLPAIVKVASPHVIVLRWAVAVCACAAVLIGWSHFRSRPTAEDLVHQPNPSTPRVQPEQVIGPPVRHRPARPIELATNTTRNTDSAAPDVVANAAVVPPPAPPHREDLDPREVVAAINSNVHFGWEAASVRPSARADDAEWLRRVSLDLWGRIPTVHEAEEFLASKRPDKRRELVDRLLDDTEFARNLTTIWTNILVGRRSELHVNRPALQKFLRTSFASNRPWNQIVYDLVAAEGNNVENGATNFLIAHLNNDALPATAVTARVFLGEQLQCNQCHNNPFSKTQQSAFWEMHSFFSQTASVQRQSVDPKSGQARYSYTELVTNTAGGPIYYETQNGLMRVAYPKFHGQPVDPSPETNRRATLARLMTEGDQPQLAAAFVNRLWEHLFGRGFTANADDLGPHSPASHPEMMNMLARQFVRSGYDTKQLIRWICASEPYQLTSRFGTDNRDDDPVEGQIPAFSRMYVKSMSPEQVYDSFLIATRAHQAGGVDWEMAEEFRQRWLSQFVVDYNTDENEEAMSLDGNLVQALTLMNGKLVDKALETSAGTVLGEVVRRRGDEKEKIRELCLAVLSRPPTASELATMRKLVRQDSQQIAAHGANRQLAEAEGYQDLLWALLNSNEFSVVH